MRLVYNYLYAIVSVITHILRERARRIKVDMKANAKNPELVNVPVEADALACMGAVSQRTGISVSELISNYARKAYIIGFDAPASHLRWEIREGRKQIAALN